MKKVALVGFRGGDMCFLHLLINALDYKDKGYEVAIILEGEACSLIPRLENNELFPSKYREARPLITAVCKACAAKLGGLEAAEHGNLPIDSSLEGHVKLSTYTDAGYEIITF
jgi:hypothetical protein